MKIKATLMSAIALLFFSSASVVLAFHGDEKDKAKEHMKDKDMCNMMKKHNQKEGMHTEDMHKENMKDMDVETKNLMIAKHKKMKTECKKKEQSKKADH